MTRRIHATSDPMRRDARLLPMTREMERFWRLRRDAPKRGLLARLMRRG